MDFNRLLRASNQQTPIEPRELYSSLPSKAEGYGYLRDVQGQILEAWHGRRNERDLVIKVNTGAGKTIDGLVILQSYLNEGHGPALYVAPTDYLVEQVRDEARRIGIATVDDPDHPKYLKGEAIAVVNVWKLFNGRSVFRGTRSPRTPAPIGAVVIDDAHAALDTARQSLSIQIDGGTNLFKSMLDLFRADLSAQAPNDVLDIEQRSFGALARVPFWAWRAKLEDARKLLHAAKDTEALKFSWPAVSPVLAFCRVVFTGTAVTVTPFCGPVEQITNFVDAKHRIYLTATLADDSVLVTDFGADPASVARPITPTTAGDIGERMILAPMELNPELPVQAVRKSMQTLAENHNVVVIVPSLRMAGTWETYTTRDKIVLAGDVSSMVARLRQEHVGLVVLVNKYDGIDLPGNACRVLVLDGLPESFSGDDRVETLLTSRTTGTDERQVQRIEQGMGRGVRSNEDHCVVFLLGARLTQLIAAPATFALFGPATRAQLEQSREIAGDLDGQPLSAIINVAKQALDRDPGWIRFARSALAAVPAAPGHVSGAATYRRQAFDHAIAGNIDGATQSITSAIEATTDERQRGWLLEQQATYLDQIDPVKAQSVLASARAKNSSVLLPMSGVTYQRLSASAAQSAAARDYLSRTYANKVALRVGFEALLDAVRFDPEQQSNEFEQAFRELGEHIGLAAQRPEKEAGEGPDVLWALGGLKYWVIEAKAGATTQFISKADYNQLTGSMVWFSGCYDATVTATPVMIHLANAPGPSANVTPGGRVIRDAELTELKTAVRAFATALTTHGRWDDQATIDRLLAGHHLRASDLSRYLKDMKKS
ncbi:Replicative superfamily II helicase [Frankineae bacterium MT45]|nr:Replicative superfamily II helicase [Frankineae bacterium MT45]